MSDVAVSKTVRAVIGITRPSDPCGAIYWLTFETQVVVGLFGWIPADGVEYAYEPSWVPAPTIPKVVGVEVDVGALGKYPGNVRDFFFSDLNSEDRSILWDRFEDAAGPVPGYGEQPADGLKVFVPKGQLEEDKRARVIKGVTITLGGVPITGWLCPDRIIVHRDQLARDEGQES